MNNIEAAKQLRDLIADRKSFLTGEEQEHDDIYLRDIEAIKVALYSIGAVDTLKIENERIRQSNYSQELVKMLTDKIGELEADNAMLRVELMRLEGRNASV